MTDKTFSLEGKIILVTGASSGIGRACAIECARAGASVVATGRDPARLEATCDAFPRPRGAYSTFCVADLTVEKDFENLLCACPAPYDGVVHAAGISALRPFAFTKPELFEKLLAFNTRIPLELTRRLLKKGMIRDGASIVFISSVAGTGSAAIGQTAYAASKSALCAAAEVMAIELAYQRTRVNCICPGVVDTPIHASVGADVGKLGVASCPLGRAGRPEEIAHAARYLLSDAAAWITGTRLVVDGGLSLR